MSKYIKVDVQGYTDTEGRFVDWKIFDMATKVNLLVNQKGLTIDQALDETVPPKYKAQVLAEYKRWHKK